MRQRLSILALAFATVCGSTYAVADDAAVRHTLRVESHWRFHAGDLPMQASKVPDGAYPATKAGNALGPAAVGYDDSDWADVDLPHDWALATPFENNNYESNGYHARGVGWYRRGFKLDPASQGRHLELQFDGVATHCTVWVNGILVARNFCGYTGFTADLTAFAHFGDDVNQVAVRVDADPIEGWWYEGAGIYRHVRLVERDPVHIATDGVYANPVRDAAGVWRVPVEVTLESSADQEQGVTLGVDLVDPDGKPVGHVDAKATVTPFVPATATASIAVAAPRLWSVDTPTLYTVRTTLRNAKGATLDQTTQRCGFRTLRFDADHGFFLNDRPVKIKGTCNHQDAAGVGVAVPDSLWAWRLKKLKEMGSNAYRSAHNPPAKELLDAADEIGMLVLDENRNFNVSPEYVRQLEWMVRRDRNHPSVFLWSVFNEEPMQGTAAGYEMVRRMRAVVRRLDDTRPVTAAISGGVLSDVGVAHAVDVVGFNYQDGNYDTFHAKFPTLPMISTEDTSAVMTRGEYVTDKRQAHTIGSYDDQWQPWGKTHRVAWQKIDTRPFVAGGFVWTGFDYRGEPQPLSWPSTGSSFGIMDQCGFPKTAYWIHQAQWIKDRPVLRIVPHWNWPGREGQPVKVMVLTNAASVELLLNGKSIERKACDPYLMVEWQVPYAPGTLEAVGFDAAGKEIARTKVETTGPAVALRLVADRTAMLGDGQDAQPVAVEAVDAEGRVVPTAKPLANFAIDGPAKVIGVANGDPICHEPDDATRRSLYNGLAQAIVLSSPGGSGAFTMTATSDGLAPATLRIALNAAPAPAELVAVPSGVLQVQKWRVSPVTKDRPDPAWEPGTTDQNTWATVDPGPLQTLGDGRFLLMRANVRPPAAVQSRGGVLTFKRLAGRAEVFVDGKSVGRKDDAAAADLEVDVPAGAARRRVVVILEAESGAKVGLGGPVTLRRPNE